MRIALVTCRDLPEPDPDEALLADALRARAIDARVVAWDDPAVAWGAFALSVLRSTWDYHLRREEFLAWCARAAAATRVLNPPAVVRWNTHKGYLRDLAARGVPVAPTAHLARGSDVELAALCAARGWSDVVIKPAVSAGSFRTARARADALEHGARHLRALLAERDALVQPYLPAVDTTGERSLVFIDGALTHAMRKSPRFSGDDEQVTGPLPVADDERDVAARALACAPDAGEPLLYARVDLARDAATGQPLVMELELTEPSLFLRQHPDALTRFVAAIAARAGARATSGFPRAGDPR